jgi:predicted NBD/HSP70 family sugar kinase
MTEADKAGTRPTGVGTMFQLLRDGRPRTRAELVAETGYARSTVADRLDLLTSAGLIGPVGEATSTGGRPPTTFAFRPGAGLVVAVDLGATHARVAITDLASHILATGASPLALAEGPSAVLTWVADTARELVGSVGRTVADITAVGVGLPGPVEHRTGRPINPPIMPGWDNAAVPQLVRDLLVPVPVLVDNDVNLMALGEHRTAWNDVSNLLMVKVATGIGAGIIADGDLRRGAEGSAGDIGHVVVPGVPNVLCRCGNVGCLEAVASGAAVAAALRAQGLDTATSGDVVARVRGGDIAASQAVRQAGRDLGGVLAVCVSMLNPSVIVIGGQFAAVGEQLIAGIREIVYQRSLPLATQNLRIVTSVAGAQAGVIGASVMAIDDVLSPQAIEALAG